MLMKLSEQPFQYLLDHVTNWGAEMEPSETPNVARSVRRG
jgi:hypothetical protein